MPHPWVTPYFSLLHFLGHSVALFSRQAGFQVITASILDANISAPAPSCILASLPIMATSKPKGPGTSYLESCTHLHCAETPCLARQTLPWMLWIRKAMRKHGIPQVNTRSTLEEKTVSDANDCSL